MAKPRASLRVFTVIYVLRGVAQEARSFVRYGEARAHLRKLSRGRDLQTDDVQLFEDWVDLPGAFRIRTSKATSAPVETRRQRRR